MSIDEIVIIAVLSYVFIVFFLSRLFVPNLTIWRRKLPDEIPKVMQDKISELEEFSDDRLDYLKNAYRLVADKYDGHRTMIFLKLFKAFRTDLEKIWNDEGYQPCNIQNYVLRTLIAKSRYFSDEDIVLDARPLNLFIHQHMHVRLDDKWVTVDPWSSSFGVPFGEEAPVFV